MTTTSWREEFVKNVRAGTAHTFLLHLNVADDIALAREGEVVRYVPFRDYLWSDLLNGRSLIVCYDRSSGITFGAETSEERKRMEDLFRRMTGLEMRRSLPRDPVEALPLIELALTFPLSEARTRLGIEATQARMALVIDFAETVAPAGNITSMSDPDRTAIVTLARWARHLEIASNKHLIVLLATNAADISTHVTGSSNNVVSIKVPLPDEAARTQRFEQLVHDVAGFCKQEDVSFGQLASASAGLPLRSISSVARQATIDHEPLGLPRIYDEKKHAIERLSGGLLRIVEPGWTFDNIGGLEEVKKELLEIAAAFRVGRTLAVPQGIILMGPPGTAKTVLAEAFAHAARVPMVDFVGLRDKWYGSSEQRQELALALIDELAPVIVRKDEAEAEDRARGSESDIHAVDQRLQRREFEFFADPKRRGKVLLFRISNRPDLMDAASLRPGRAELCMPVLPSKRDAPDIFERLIKKIAERATQNGTPLSFTLQAIEIETVLKGRGALTGAEIWTVLHLAVKFAADQGRSEVDINDLRQALDDYIAPSMMSDYFRMILLAVKHTTNRRLVPEEWRERLGKQAEKDLADLAEESWLLSGKEKPSA